jgi:hypothetical protein
MKKLTVVPHTFASQEDLMNAFRPLEPLQYFQVVGPWQKCPVCNGAGEVLREYAGKVNSWTTPCPTCKGSRIISSVTGLPPAEANNTTVK